MLTRSIVSFIHTHLQLAELAGGVDHSIQTAHKTLQKFGTEPSRPDKGLEGLNAALSALEEVLAKTTAELTDEQKKLRSKTAEHEAAVAKIEALQRELTDLRAEMKKASEEAEKRLAAAKAEIASLRERFKKLQEQYVMLCFAFCLPWL